MLILRTPLRHDDKSAFQPKGLCSGLSATHRLDEGKIATFERFGTLPFIEPACAEGAFQLGGRGIDEGRMNSSPVGKSLKPAPYPSDPVQAATSAIHQVLRDAQASGSPEAIKDLVCFTNSLSQTLMLEANWQCQDSGFWIDAIDKVLSIAVTDTKGTILYANSRFCDISGYASSELVGSNHRLLNSGFHGKRFFREMYATIRGGRIWRGEICNRAKDGSLYWMATTIIPRLDSGGKVCQYVACRFDITELKRAQQHLVAVANIDPLTGLLNRRAFQSELAKTVDPLAGGRQGVALVLLDLDNFKDINDIHGHDAGDELLKAVSSGIRRSVRATDIVARLGGDEFAVVFTPSPSRARLVQLLASIRDAVGISAFDSYRLSASMSMGIACLPDHGATPAELLKNADIALYNAKRLGRDRYEFFTPALQDATVRRLSMQDQARNGLRDGRFCLHYQPVVSLADESLKAVEASLRWEQPNLDLVGSNEFAEIFDDFRLATAFGDFVRESAVSQIADWTKNGVNFGKVAINATAADFLVANYCERLSKAMISAGMTHGAISIEVSEGLFLGKQSTRVREEANRLREAGYEVVLNDFGAGYAALTHLKELSVDGIRIDSSLVRGLGRNNTDQKIIRGIIEIAHSLDLNVTAKGIATEEQLRLLRNMGCDRGQGSVFSEPLPAQDFPLFVREFALHRRRSKHRGSRQSER